MRINRTTRQSAIVVEGAILEIKSHNNPSDELISEICLKWKISESHIRAVAGIKESKIKTNE